jgi:alpha-mannosidase
MRSKEETLVIERSDLFLKRLRKSFLLETLPFDAEFAWSKEAVPFEQRACGDFKKIKEDASWGKAWESAWFHLKVQVPEHWRAEQIVAELDFSGEGLVRDASGKALQGITNGSIFDANFARTLVPLDRLAEPGAPLELWVETAANSLFGVYLDADPQPGSKHRFGHFDAKVVRMRLALFDEALWQLYLDLRVLRGLALRLPSASVRRARVIRAINDGMNLYAKDPSQPQAARERLQVELKKKAAPSDLRVQAVGHAHIDTAWLWPVKESVRKCMRTFATQLDLIERYPDYVFGASQAQHYAFVKQHDPELYSRIQAAVQKGQWELQGGMWVEADCNLISGESMIRQVLHGKQFFWDEFGVDVDNLWLPDVFGYSAAMPQILQASGIKSFLTQKLSWSQFNDFPHHTFMWQGIDGSQVLTHFPPENTYNSELDTEFLCPAQENFKERDHLDEFISLFGVGDGGGGPKPESLELGRRLADLEGAPRVSFGDAKSFFERLHKHAHELETWVGELYLELHRGTFTTQAHAKQGNRELENLLRSLEFVYSSLPLEHYPSAELDRLWKRLLMNQFHDILPGSSIHKVYEQTRLDYAEMHENCAALLESAAGLGFEKDADSFVLVNPLHEAFDACVDLPESWQGALLSTEEGEVFEVHQEGAQCIARLLVPPYGMASFKRVSPAQPPSVEQAVSNLHEPATLLLENEFVRYEFNSHAQLISAFDKTCDQLVSLDGQPGNLLSLYEDRPNNWDAWDIDIFYLDAKIEDAVSTQACKLEKNPLRQSLHFVLKIGESEIHQCVRLESTTKRLDFKTLVHWREKHKMLRVAFPVAIRTEAASFDIQYGFVKRPTHQNTSWERAKFEVVGHRFADLSDEDYGVALLNDCKYGYRVQDQTLDLNLLRSPTNPDPDADEGEHSFTYSLQPHEGGLVGSSVQAEANALNRPPLLMDGYTLSKNSPSFSPGTPNTSSLRVPVQVTGEGLSLETLKRAEKEDALILRIVETRGRRSKGQLHLPVGATLQEVDLMEWRESGDEFVATDSPYSLELTKFEIRSFRVKF